MVYLYRTGFSRFSLSQYSHAKNNMDNLYMHLTNASIQKTADDYDKSAGCKWDLRSLKLLLISLHGVHAVCVGS